MATKFMYKNFTISALIFTLLISCNNQATKNMENGNEKIIEELYNHLNSHNWEKMADLYADSAEFKDPSLGAGVIKQSHQQIVEKYQELNDMFPDIKDEIQQIYPSGQNHIIVEFISTGTAPDGTKFSLPICSIFEIKDGKIIKDYTYYDNMQEPA